MFSSAQVVLFDNITDMKLQFSETRSPGVMKFETFTVEPYSSKKVRATEFRERCINSGRSSVLKILMDGQESGRVLSSQDLIDFQRIVFHVQNGKLHIQGRKAETDLWRFLRFLFKEKGKDIPLEEI